MDDEFKGKDLIGANLNRYDNLQGDCDLAAWRREGPEVKARDFAFEIYLKS